jgi:hypothetical protein
LDELLPNAIEICDKKPFWYKMQNSKRKNGRSPWIADKKDKYNSQKVVSNGLPIRKKMVRIIGY